jgi:hypothetical protein
MILLFVINKELLQSLKLGRPPRRDENYIKTHTRKNGVPLPQAQDTIVSFYVIANMHCMLLKHFMTSEPFLFLIEYNSTCC